MRAYLNPDKIYDDLLINNISKKEAINLLFSLVEKTRSSYTKVRCLEILAKLKKESSEIVNYISILVKDKFREVRSRALKLILEKSPEKGFILAKTLIPKEDSFFVLISIYRALSTKKKEEFRGLIQEIIVKVANFHRVVFEEGKFILDLYATSNSNEFLDLELNDEYYNKFISNLLYHLFLIYHGYEGWVTRFIIKNSHIICLDCTLMELVKLPESVELLSRLRYLKLNENYLKALPNTINRLCWLKGLDLSSNKFRTLPNMLANLKNLEKFNFKNNYSLEYLPNWITHFSEKIYAEKYIRQGVTPKEAPILGIFQLLLGPKLEKLKDCTYGEGGRFYKLNKNGNIIGIYIYGNYPDTPVLPLIPEQISELKFIEELYLPCNKIKKIPKSIGKLAELKYLNLSFNEISEIKNLKFLINLKKLELEFNKIASIKGLKDLRNLIEVRLDGNPILNWSGLTNLKDLRKLSFSGRCVNKSWKGLNKISEILGFTTLENLEELNLSCNNIVEIENLENFLNLKKLNLRNNKINEIKGLENLSNLKYLNLAGNPISEELIKSLGGYKMMGGQKIIKYPQKLVEYCRKADKV